MSAAAHYAGGAGGAGGVPALAVLRMVRLVRPLRTLGRFESLHRDQHVWAAIASDPAMRAVIMQWNQVTLDQFLGLELSPAAHLCRLFASFEGKTRLELDATQAAGPDPRPTRDVPRSV